jgi:hypothetical protein
MFEGNSQLLAEARDFGNHWLGPLVAKVFLALEEASDCSLDQRQILFPSREGWFLIRLWERARKDGLLIGSPAEGSYIYANRRITNRTHRIFDRAKREVIARSSFLGSIDLWLYSRLGLRQVDTCNVLAASGLSGTETIELPADQELATFILDILIRDMGIYGELKNGQTFYREYLLSTVKDARPIYCDLGYSGSVVSSLAALLGRDFLAVFFQGHLPYEVPTEERVRYRSVLTPPVLPNSPAQLGKMTLILEGVFRAPENGLLKVNASGEPIFDDLVEASPLHLRVIESIVDGVYERLNALLSVGSPNERKSEVFTAAGNMILASMTGAIPLTNRLLSTLDVEDSFTGQASLKQHLLRI